MESHTHLLSLHYSYNYSALPSSGLKHCFLMQKPRAMKITGCQGERAYRDGVSVDKQSPKPSLLCRRWYEILDSVGKKISTWETTIAIGIRNITFYNNCNVCGLQASGEHQSPDDSELEGISLRKPYSFTFQC